MNEKMKITRKITHLKKDGIPFTKEEIKEKLKKALEKLDLDQTAIIIKKDDESAEDFIKRLNSEKGNLMANAVREANAKLPPKPKWIRDKPKFVHTSTPAVKKVFEDDLDPDKLNMRMASAKYAIEQAIKIRASSAQDEDPNIYQAHTGEHLEPAEAEDIVFDPLLQKVTFRGENYYKTTEKPSNCNEWGHECEQLKEISDQIESLKTGRDSPDGYFTKNKNALDEIEICLSTPRPMEEFKLLSPILHKLEAILRNGA